MFKIKLLIIKYVIIYFVSKKVKILILIFNLYSKYRIIILITYSILLFIIYKIIQ